MRWIPKWTAEGHLEGYPLNEATLAAGRRVRDGARPTTPSRRTLTTTKQLRDAQHETRKTL